MSGIAIGAGHRSIVDLLESEVVTALGVSVVDAAAGVRVTLVHREDSGFLPGDEITTYNGNVVHDRVTLQRLTARTPSRAPLSVDVRRDGKARVIPWRQP